MMRCEENPIINVSMIAISTMLHCYIVTNDTVGGKILAIVFVGAISTMLNCHSLMLLDDIDVEDGDDASSMMVMIMIMIMIMTGGTPSAPKHPATDDDNLVDENYDEGNDGDGGDNGDHDVECW